MCGICGVVQISGAPRPVVSAEVLDWMTDVMTHRGPDDRGTHLADGIALGVRRLSIVDVEGGHQPVTNEDGRIWAIQNGELYNHVELRSELAGHRFRSRCDTEVIPHLYERSGKAFPEHLRGKFGIAVWDERERSATLARDRLGIKPLYYARAGDLLVFGSELKSVLASGLVGPDLDYEAIDAYLTFGFVPGPRTPLAQVSKLLPGHRLLVRDGAVRTERYWEYPRPHPDSPPRRVEEYAAELLELLEESVRLRLMSDVPLGAMLSGGIDSSLIVALMARNMGEPVKTFSVGFREDEEFSELADARYVAEVFGTDHHELELSFADQSVNLEQLVWHLDEPLADLSALGFLALSELASQHVTVALSGQGADELLGGYTRYRTAAIAESWKKLPGPLRHGAERLAARGPRRVRRASRLLSTEDPVERILEAWSSESALQPVRAPDGPVRRPGDAARRVVEARLNGFQSRPLAELLYFDAQLALVDDMLHYFDRASMAHSLEVRVPFLDHEVVEYCARIPTPLKVRRLTTKYLLKRAARPLLPRRIVDKRKIGFFHGAVERWIAEQAPKAVADYVTDRDAHCLNFLAEDEVKRLAAEQAVDGRYDSSHLLLRILMLEIWLSTLWPAATGVRGEVATRWARGDGQRGVAVARSQS